MARGAHSGDTPALARENWGSRVGVILAVAGSAVGLGNFLRFPGLAAMNGGGVFMIPYFISLLVLGIPVCWVEWTMGRYGGTKGFNSAPGIFSVLWRHPISKYFGALALIVPVGIYMYYVYIEAWCLAYAWDYATGAMRQYGTNVDAFKSHFEQFVGKASNGFLLSESTRNGAGGATGNVLQESVIFLVIVFVINFVLIYRGVVKGIETFCKFAMPVLMIAAVVILIRVLTLGTPDPAQPENNVNAALGYMWNPRIEGGDAWKALANPQLWLNAAGQIFFSLSVGFGIILNYASYLRRDDDVALSGLTACSMNEFCEVCLGGLITVPVAFLFLGSSGMTQDNLGSSFSLGFNALPAVFARMPLGQFFGMLWFFLLFTAAITSSLSMLQPAIAFFEEGFNLSRRIAVTCLGMITAIGSMLVVYFSKNLLALDTLDTWIGTLCIFILATVQVITVGWLFGIDRASAEAARGAALRIPRFVWYVAKYVSPVYLLTIFGLWCYYQLPSIIGGIRKLPREDKGTVLLMLSFIVVLLIFFGLLVNLAGKRWRQQGRLDPRGSTWRGGRQGANS